MCVCVCVCVWVCGCVLLMLSPVHVRPYNSSFVVFGLAYSLSLF